MPGSGSRSTPQKNSGSKTLISIKYIAWIHGSSQSKKMIKGSSSQTLIMILILLQILYCLSLLFRVFDLLKFENSSSDSNFMKVIEYVLSLRLVINIQPFHIYYMLTNLIYPYRIYTIITFRKSVEFNISQLLCIHYIVIWPEVGHFSK